MQNRKEQIIVCAESIKRNAEYIAQELQYNQSIHISIDIEPGAIPTVEIRKVIVPVEVCEAMNKDF